jgi:hypothetical protein
MLISSDLHIGAPGKRSPARATSLAGDLASFAAAARRSIRLHIRFGYIRGIIGFYLCRGESRVTSRLGKVHLYEYLSAYESFTTKDTTLRRRRELL